MSVANLREYYTAIRQSLSQQSNVIKTMIIVSAFYVVAWTPINVYYLLVNVSTNLTLIDIILVAT